MGAWPADADVQLRQPRLRKLQGQFVQRLLHALVKEQLARLRDGGAGKQRLQLASRDALKAAHHVAQTQRTQQQKRQRGEQQQSLGVGEEEGEEEAAVGGTMAGGGDASDDGPPPKKPRAGGGHRCKGHVRGTPCEFVAAGFSLAFGQKCGRCVGCCALSGHDGCDTAAHVSWARSRVGKETVAAVRAARTGTGPSPQAIGPLLVPPHAATTAAAAARLLAPGAATTAAASQTQALLLAQVFTRGLVPQGTSGGLAAVSLAHGGGATTAFPVVRGPMSATRAPLLSQAQAQGPGRAGQWHPMAAAAGDPVHSLLLAQAMANAAPRGSGSLPAFPPIRMHGLAAGVPLAHNVAERGGLGVAVPTGTAAAAPAAAVHTRPLAPQGSVTMAPLQPALWDAGFAPSRGPVQGLEAVAGLATAGLGGDGCARGAPPPALPGLQPPGGSPTAQPHAQARVPFSILQPTPASDPRSMANAAADLMSMLAKGLQQKQKQQQQLWPPHPM